MGGGLSHNTDLGLWGRGSRQRGKGERVCAQMVERPLRQNAGPGWVFCPRRTCLSLAWQWCRTSLCGVRDLPIVERGPGLLCPVHRRSRQVPPCGHPRTLWQVVASVEDGPWAGWLLRHWGKWGRDRLQRHVCDPSSVRRTTRRSHV